MDVCSCIDYRMCDVPGVIYPYSTVGNGVQYSVRMHDNHWANTLETVSAAKFTNSKCGM
jgi:hypothetical protein